MLPEQLMMLKLFQLMFCLMRVLKIQCDSFGDFQGLCGVLKLRLRMSLVSQWVLGHVFWPHCLIKYSFTDCI